MSPPAHPNWLERLIGGVLTRKVMMLVVVIIAVGWGILTAPFDWNLGGLPRNPVPVDAIPDIGENQQIVFTGWPGRSPQDIEDQITYPLSTELKGIPGVREIRAMSGFGFSQIYVVFEDDVNFYWARSRVLERLASAQASSCTASDPKDHCAGPPWMPVSSRSSMRRVNPCASNPRRSTGAWRDCIT